MVFITTGVSVKLPGLLGSGTKAIFLASLLKGPETSGPERNNPKISLN